MRKVESLSNGNPYALAEKEIAELFASKEAAEGMRAFGQKCPPSRVTSGR